MIGDSESDTFLLAPGGALEGVVQAIDYFPTGQPSGFEGVAGPLQWWGRAPPPSGTYELLAFGGDGKQASNVALPSPVGSYSPDPLGGLVVLAYSNGAASQVLSYDVAGNQRWAFSIAESATTGILGVDVRGNTLLLLVGVGGYAPGIEGRWIDSKGSAGSPFAAGASLGTLFPRLGGGLFLADGANWTEFPALSTAPENAPTWLQQRPHVALQIVEGGQGYGIVPVSEVRIHGYCDQYVEVVDQSGASCGKAQLPEVYEFCNASLGLDGTLFQAMSPTQANCGANGCACAWQIWPGLLR